MAISMHDISVGVFSRMLANLSACLDKAAAYAAEKKFDTAVLLSSRLAPDMYALTRQVQLASDFAKGCCARLAGVEVPKREDNETTLEQLKARLDWTRDFIGSISKDKFNGAEDRVVARPQHNTTVNVPALQYLQTVALPNFYFHVTTAYDILRHNGVPLGKKDFVGA